MGNCADLVRLCQHLIEMAAPARRIGPFAFSERCRVIQYRFDPLAHPACRFWLFGPDRFRDREDVIGLDRTDVPIA